MNELHVVSSFDEPEPSTARTRGGNYPLIYCSMFSLSMPGWNPAVGSISTFLPWNTDTNTIEPLEITLQEPATIAFFYSITLECFGDVLGDIQFTTKPSISPDPTGLTPGQQADYYGPTTIDFSTLGEVTSQSSDCVFTRAAGVIQLGISLSLSAPGNFFLVNTRGHLTAIVGLDNGSDCYNIITQA